MSLRHNARLGKSSDCILALNAAEIDSYAGSGNTWYDLSPQQNHCTPTESSYMPTFVSSSEGKYFEFAGAPSHQNFRSANNSPIDGPNMTISVIAGFQMYNQLAARFAPVVSCGLEGGGSRGRFACVPYGYGAPSSSDIGLGTDHWAPGGRRTTAGNGISDGVNYVCGWVIDNWATHRSTAKVFVDGVERPTYGYSNNSAPTGPIGWRFHIGNWQVTRDDMDWNGRIYFVYVYARVLSDNEVSKISKYLAPLIGKTI